MSVAEQGLLALRSGAGCSRRTFLMTVLVGALATLPLAYLALRALDGGVDALAPLLRPRTLRGSPALLLEIGELEPFHVSIDSQHWRQAGGEMQVRGFLFDCKGE